MKLRILCFLMAALTAVSVLTACGKKNVEQETVYHQSAKDVLLETEPPTSAPTEPPPREQDWDELNSINEEIDGWLRLDGTPIDYHVLYHSEDDENSQFYLSHTYTKEYAFAGSVFVDYRCRQGVASKNVILHAHNMNDGSMFHELLNYSSRFNGDLDYFREHSILTFNTEDEDAKWKIISVFKTSTLAAHGEFFNYMQGVFTSNEDFMDYVQKVRIRSLFNVPVTVNEDDQLLTLSTCSYEYESFRTVVVARKVRPGEDPAIDLNKVTVNEDPYLPEVCYYGERPPALTFRQAYKKNLTPWYDGDFSRIDQKIFTATYLNMDGSPFKAYILHEGDPVPVPEEEPAYDDENFTYTFIGWNNYIEGVDFQALNASILIAPQFDIQPK